MWTVKLSLALVYIVRVNNSDIQVGKSKPHFDFILFSLNVRTVTVEVRELKPNNYQSHDLQFFSRKLTTTVTTHYAPVIQ